MSSQYLKKDKFLLGSSPSGNALYSHIPELSHTDELGTIFVLIEDESCSTPCETEPFEKIFKLIEHYYYQIYNDQQTNNEAFEKTLKSTNNEILRMIQKEELVINLDNFNILVGLLYPVSGEGGQFDLLLSSYGRLNAYLIHKMQLDCYKLIEILEKPPLKDDTKLMNLFTNIISGKVSVKDSLFLCNNAVLNYLSEDEITNIISKLDPESATAELINLLGPFNENFAGIIIKPQKQEIMRVQTEEKIPEASPISDEVINDLILQDTPDNKLLGIIKKFNISKIIFWGKTTFCKGKIVSLDLFQKIKRQKYANNCPPSTGDILNKKAQNKKQKILKSVNKKKAISRYFRTKINNFVTFIQRLSSKSKTLLVIALILSGSFYYSVVWVGHRQKKQKEAEQYRRLVKNIINKKNQAEASIIYQEEGKAKSLIDNVKDLLNDIKPNSKEKKNFIVSTNSAVETLLQKIRHIVNIETPEQIIDLAPFNPQMDLTDIEILNNTIYAFDKQDNSIYKINLDNTKKEVEKLSTPTDLNKIKFIKSLNNEILIIGENNKIYKITDNETKKFTDNFKPNANIKDLEYYNDKIYALDTENSQIYKYTQKDNILTFDKAWLKQKLNLTNATQLSIDGSIYLLSNNHIITLRNGQKASQNIKLETIDPPVVSVIKIYTDSETNNFYFLEANEKRIIEMDKNGVLKHQYLSKEFGLLKDFIIQTQADKTQGYILTKNRIYKIYFNK